MNKIIITLVAIYLLGFAFFFIVEAASGPVTLGLAFLRALFWPVYWTTGWPHGVHARMD